MKANKEPVKLRERKLLDGQVSLYLACFKMEKWHYEFLKLYYLDKPKNPIDREHKKNTIELAHRIKAKRIEELINSDYNFSSKAKTKIDLIVYFEGYSSRYLKKDKRTMDACLREFKTFLKEVHKVGSIQAGHVTETMLIEYKEYLVRKFNGDTPHTYFGRFKKAIKQAYRDKLFHTNPITAIKEFRIKTDTGLRKDVLNFEEIQLLAKTPCVNEIVKRAFLFACNTGLRYCDLSALIWKDIKKDEMRVLQSKTEQTFSIKLNNNALMLMGNKGKQDERVFNLPSFNGSIKSVRKWVALAGIEKRITWHSCRHSFAVNLLISKNNPKTVSDLLGHQSLKHTEKYLRAVKSMEEEAVNSLPDIKLV